MGARTRSHRRSAARGTPAALKSLPAAPLHPSPRPPLWRPLIMSGFELCLCRRRGVGTTRHLAFSEWRLPLSNTQLSVFCDLIARLFLLLKFPYLLSV